MLKIKICILIFSNILLINGEIDWCNKTLLCKNAPGPHIKCNNDGKFGQKCASDVQMIKLTKDDRQNIVEAHNVKRNDIAAGQVPGYEPAERMSQMKWSEELAKMAELNVKTCTFGHDKCRNTPNFPTSGQNLYTWGGYPAPTNLKEYFFNAIDKWFIEHKDCDMSYINKYKNHKEGKKIGHFTVMVSDRNNRVGCAGVKFTEGKFTKILIACNYAATNIRQKSIYKAGRTGSGCKDGIDTKFKALCKQSEKYN